MGFRVTMLNSLLSETQNGCGLAFDHPILLVELDERWIVDVGFSDAYRVPLRLDVSGDQAGLHSRYRLTPDGDGRWKFWELENEEWVFHYAFSLRPARLGDFLEACHHYETSPKSSFTQKLICTRATADGHISLTNQRLVICRHEQKEETTLAGEEDVADALRTHFGIALQERFRQPVSV
jgi:N-hydroxyarylamine O-acetyltransferase